MPELGLEKQLWFRVLIANWILEEKLTGKFDVSNGHSWTHIVCSNNGTEEGLNKVETFMTKSSSSQLLFSLSVHDTRFLQGYKDCKVGFSGSWCFPVWKPQLWCKCPPHLKGQKLWRHLGIDSKLGDYSGRLWRSFSERM